MTIDPARLRAAFPALARTVAGRPAVFADAPGGTQVPETVIAAMADYLRQRNANLGGAFVTSAETVSLVAGTRAATAAFLGAASADEIFFGQNMTSLTFALSRALSRDWRAGDEVVVTALDHDANVAPWRLAAEERGAVVRVMPATADCDLAAVDLAPLLNARTRLVALPAAANAVGTVVDLRPLIDLCHRAGALVHVDAVHHAPHAAIDVTGLDCDFLVCSAYKFFGPHLGIGYGKRAHLAAFTACKVRPASAEPPGKWETGTQSFEAIAGLRATLAYLGGLGSGEPLSRAALVGGMDAILAHERTLSARFLDRVRAIPGLRLYGTSDPGRRTPTFGLTLAGWTPADAARRLGDRGIFTWAGHFYAVGLIAQLGLAEHGGLLRIGFAHYHSRDDVDRVADELAGC